MPFEGLSRSALYGRVSTRLSRGVRLVVVLVFVVVVVSSNARSIKKARAYLHLHIQKFADMIFPKMSAPGWLVQVSEKTAIISWTAFIVLFIVLGVRIPPTYDEVVSGFMISSLVVLVLYLAHVVVTSLNRQK